MKFGRLLRDVSIRSKILSLVLLVTTVALMLVSVTLLVLDYNQFRTDTARELTTQARIVLENSTAAMSFYDYEAARETLETLSPNPHVRLGCLYAADAQVFAQYAPHGESGGDAPVCPGRPPPAGYRFTANTVEVVVATEVAGLPAGSVYLESDLDEVVGRARVQAFTTALVLALALGVALLLSSVLQRIISEPIDALVAVSREVSSRHDYSLRAWKSTDDELGVLVDAFNGMLSQIERAEQERAGLLARERDANRLKDEFLMTLSHELRTPLNAIQGWTRMLISGVIPPADVAKALQKIEHNTHAQARLVEDLLEVSRFTTGKFRLERLPLDLIAVANLAIEAVRPDAESRGVGIVREFDSESVPMEGDPDRLQQVIWNLLSNAVKFSAIDSQVTVAIRAGEGFGELRVSDNGIGIDPAFLPSVFEPFRQADASSTRAYGGLGLGLSIVQRIVALHGGTIAAESAGRGRGATFTVRLPIRVPAAETSVRPPIDRPHLVPGDLSGTKVLVVDDDADTREIVTTVLTAAGARVREARSVADALRAARETAPDLLVTDIAMPDQDGFKLLSELRGKFGRAIPRVAIALTAQATHADRERALAAGFDRHVAKPFDPISLVELLREALAASSHV